MTVRTVFRISNFLFLLVFLSFGVARAGQLESDKKVKFKPRYQRIISLKPNITQILLQLGLAEQIVGVTKFCPPTNGSAQIVADYNSIKIEEIIRLKPDLILISPENSQSRQYAALSAAKLNLRLFSFGNFNEMKQSVTDMAKLIRVEAQGDALLADMDQRLANLSTIQKQKHPITKSYIIIVQRRPLMVASGNTYISSLFEKVGLRNVFAANQIAFPVIDEEELIREHADYTFDISHYDASTFEPRFLNKAVRPLPIEDFLASPQSVVAMERLLGEL